MMRRDFLESIAATAIATNVREVQWHRHQQSPEVWRAAFLALRQKINGKPLAYLDNAATTLRPQPMIDSLSVFYARENANPGAALHTLARRASAALEGARSTVASFIGA